MKQHFYYTLFLALSLFAASAMGGALKLSSSDLLSIANSRIDIALQTYKEQGFRVESKIGNISPKLTVADCIEGISTNLRRDIMQTHNNTLEISCETPTWKVFVPAEIKIFGKVLVAASSIAKKSTIKRHHIISREQQLNLTRYGTYTQFKDIAGMLTRRSVRQGEVIKPSQLKAPTVIQRGDQVIITAHNPGITIQMKGEALSSGILGQQISVRNTTSNRVVRAEVTEKGRVAVIL